MLRVCFVTLLLTFVVVAAQPIDQQLIFAPAQFNNATQWGIGVAATPTHDAGFIVGFNYTDGRAFAQYYEQNATHAWVEVDAVMYGDLLTGFDTTEMNPAGALVSTDTLTRVWSVSTVNDSLISYGFVYVWSRPDIATPATLTQTLLDSSPGANRIYGGALWGKADASVICVGSPVYPVSGPSNTVPSIVEVWTRTSLGHYALEHTIAVVEPNTGLFGYSGDITEDGRWLAVGAWHGLPRSVFLYDRLNNYTLAATLAPFGNVTRFGYSMRFSPDGQWLIVGVFQYPSPGFVGATLAYRFNATADAWITDSYFFLTTGAPYDGGAPGQGASVSVSNNYTLNGTDTRWTLVYGMPYYEQAIVNNTASVAVWTFANGNWTEQLPSLEVFGNFSDPPVYLGSNSTERRWSSFNDTVPDPFFDLGWPSQARNMLSYDACSAIVAGIGNVGLFTGAVFRWMNVTEGCPRVAPVAPPIESPVEAPVNLPVAAPVTAPTSTPTQSPVASPTAATTAGIAIAVVAVIFVFAALVAIFRAVMARPPVQYSY